MGILGGKKVLTAGIQYSRLLEDSKDNPAWDLIKKNKLQKDTPCSSLNGELIIDKNTSNNSSFNRLKVAIKNKPSLFVPNSSVKTKKFIEPTVMAYLQKNGFRGKLQSIYKREATDKEKALHYMHTYALENGYTIIAYNRISKDSIPHDYIRMDFSYQDYEIIDGHYYAQYHQTIVLTNDLTIPFVSADNYLDNCYIAEVLLDSEVYTVAIPDNELNLDLNSVENTVQSLPVFPLRIHSENINGISNDTYKNIWHMVDTGTCGDCSVPKSTATTEDYIETRNALKILSMDLDQMTNSICVSPSIDDVVDAFIVFNLDMRSDNPIVNNAIFKTIKLFTNDYEVPNTTNKYDPLHLNGNYNPYRYSHTPTKLKGRTISETLELGTYNYKIECRLDFFRHTGRMSTVGYTTSSLRDKHYSILQQTSENTFEQYVIYELKVTTVVKRGNKAAKVVSVLDSNTEDQVMLPLFYEVIDSMLSKDKKTLYENSMQLAIFAGHITKIPWYQTGVFKFVITVGMLALNFATMGAATPLSIAVNIAIATAINLTVSLYINKLVKKAKKAAITQKKLIDKLTKKLEDTISGKRAHGEDEPVVEMTEVVQTVLIDESQDMRPSDALSIAKGAMMYNTEILYNNCNKFKQMKSTDIRRT